MWRVGKIYNLLLLLFFFVVPIVIIAAVSIAYCCCFWNNVQGNNTKAIKSKWPKDDTKISAHNNDCARGVGTYDALPHPLSLTPWGYKYTSTQKFIDVLIEKRGCCTIRRSPTTTAGISYSLSSLFAIRSRTNDTQNAYSKRANERERKRAYRLVGPAAHATSYWKRASQAKPAKQRREYDTKATLQKRLSKEERAKLFANTRQFVGLPRKKIDSHNYNYKNILCEKSSANIASVSSRLHPEANFRNRATIHTHSCTDTHAHTHTRSHAQHTCNGQQ